MAILETLRWIVPALVPAAMAGVLVLRSDLRKEPLPLALVTFVLGAAAAGCTAYLTSLAMRLTGLDVRSRVVGEGPALLFLFCLVAPLGEVSKVVATWPAFRSHHFDKPYDGVVYSALTALGFTAVETAVALHAHPSGSIWIARAVLAMPAQVFFACFWGYALGRAKQARRRPTSIFPVAWVVATASHGLYAHIVYGRGPGALVGVVPLLLAMGGVSWVAWRDSSSATETRRRRACGRGAGRSASRGSRSSRARPIRRACTPCGRRSVGATSRSSSAGLSRARS